MLCVFVFSEVEVGKDQEFTVNTQGAGGQGEVGVKMTSPSGRPIPCKLEADRAKAETSVKYIPPEEGQYKVDVSYDGNPVQGSPFTVDALMPSDPSKVRAMSQTTLLLTIQPINTVTDPLWTRPKPHALLTKVLLCCTLP